MNRPLAAPPARPAAGSAPSPVPGPDARAADPAADDMLAAMLIRMWCLASGRSLRPGIRPEQLSTGELIDFWADDFTAAPGRHAAPPARPHRRSGPVIGLSGEPFPWPADGQTCAMFVADITGFTRRDRDEEIQIHLRRALDDMIRQAFNSSGIPWDLCPQQDRGDGPLIIIPPGNAAHAIIDPLPDRLRHLIRRHNRFAVPAARLQVRAAIHAGPVFRDEHGYAGEDINLLCRMLDAQPLRDALTGTTAELALIVSAHIHDTIVLRHPSLIDPALFRPVKTSVKRTRVSGWIYMPGSPPP
jgi:class 3 adenylate cyclase